MKQVHPSYSFVASTKTITLTGLNIDQDQLLLIVNATRGVQYFNFADSSLRATVTAGTNTTVVLTDASTTGHANGDALVIYYDDQVTGQVVSGTVTANPGTGAFTVSGTVGLDNASLVALENITVTVGAAISGTVTVANFPSTQTVAGTVTANDPSWTAVTFVDFYANPSGSVTLNGFTASQILIHTIGDGSGTAEVQQRISDAEGWQTLGSLPLADYTTGTFSPSKPEVQVICSVPPSLGGAAYIYSRQFNNSFAGLTDTQLRASPVGISGTVTIGASSVTFNTNIRNSVTISSLPAISGTVTANVSSTTVTVSSFPRPTWTDYSGSVVTANSAVTAVSTVTRSYLLAQVTTGQMFLNIGATCTTGNGVYFSAGQGFAWETSVPQGIVSIISSVTGTKYVLKDG